jgi:hypothetical protein
LDYQRISKAFKYLQEKYKILKTYISFIPVTKRFQHINDKLFKVQNMLATHAILYITSNYILNVRNALITKPDYYNDVIMSQIQNKTRLFLRISVRF